MAEIASFLNVSYKTTANNRTQLKQKLGADTTLERLRIVIDVVRPDETVSMFHPVKQYRRQA